MDGFEFGSILLIHSIAGSAPAIDQRTVARHAAQHGCKAHLCGCTLCKVIRNHLAASCDSMRYPQGLEVLLLKPNTTETYDEVEHGSYKYAVGKPGEVFWVRVKVPQHMFSQADTIKIHLYVEGRSQGYNYTLHKGRASCTFRGYGVVLDGQQRYRNFQFAGPSCATDVAAPAPAPESGQLRVKFTHVTVLSEQPGAGSLSAMTFQTAHKLREDKKWYEQPSLSVRPGAVTDTFTLRHTEDNTVAELAQCVLHLETATVLHLRKGLQESNPVHHRILAAAGLMPMAGADGTSLAPASKFSTPSTHQKLGVKRKLAFQNVNSQTVVDLSGPEPRSNTSSNVLECIDLTQA